MSHQIHNQRVPKKILNETLFILLAAFVTALVINSLRPGGIRFFSTPPSGVADAPPASGNTDGAAAISLESALAAHQKEETVFADARPQADYEAGHIKGALHLPVHRFETWIDTFIQNHPIDTPIITYCDGPNCHLGEDLAEQLVFAGYENVRHLQNGWSRWKAAGGPDAYGP